MTLFDDLLAVMIYVGKSSRKESIEPDWRGFGDLRFYSVSFLFVCLFAYFFIFLKAVEKNGSSLDGKPSCVFMKINVTGMRKREESGTRRKEDQPGGYSNRPRRGWPAPIQDVRVLGIYSALSFILGRQVSANGSTFFTVVYGIVSYDF